MNYVIENAIKEGEVEIVEVLFSEFLLLLLAVYCWNLQDLI